MNNIMDFLVIILLYIFCFPCEMDYRYSTLRKRSIFTVLLWELILIAITIGVALISVLKNFSLNFILIMIISGICETIIFQRILYQYTVLDNDNSKLLQKNVDYKKFIRK